MTSATQPTSRQRLLEIIRNSDLFQTYVTAFECMTALPLQLQLASQKEDHLTTDVNAAGITQTCVPVKVGKAVVAKLCIGGVKLVSGSPAVKKPQAATMDSSRYSAAVSLLESFAFQLGESMHRLWFATTSTEPEPVRHAKAFIAEHVAEPISLESVANNAHLSPFHFCKVFKRSTGMTFTDYVSHVRVEKARRMLQRPDARITDVAYDVGFQSLSHFNRSFRRIVNESPTSYRARLKDCGPEHLAAA